MIMEEEESIGTIATVRRLKSGDGTYRDYNFLSAAGGALLILLLTAILCFCLCFWGCKVCRMLNCCKDNRPANKNKVMDTDQEMKEIELGRS